MLDDKYIKNILYGIGLVLLTIGQFYLLGGRGMVPGVVFTVFCMVFFILALTGKYDIFITLSKKVFEAIRAAIEAAKERNRLKKEGPAPQKKPVKIKKEDKKLQAKIKPVPAEKALPAEPRVPLGTVIFTFLKNLITGNTGIIIRFTLPRWSLFTVTALVFGGFQFLLLKGSLKMAALVLITDILLLVASVIMKEGLKVEFSMDNGLKLVSFIAGAVLVIIGWIFLIDQKIPTQMMGVACTIPGAVLMFLGLPKNIGSEEAETDRADILLQKPAFLNNYFVKAALLIAAFALLKFGIKVMQHQDYNMYSMIFYAVSFLFVFLALPLINYTEQRSDNRILDFIKLGMVIAALFIAYKGQVLFTKNNVSSAVNHFFLAAVFFIIAFPVYLKKTQEEKESIPRSIEVIFVILITAIGTFLRVYELDVRPFGLENDEAGGLTARLTRDGDTKLNLSVGNFGIFVHIVRIFIWLYGGMDRVGIKYEAVIMGILAIPVMYFFIRSVFNAKTAMFATIVFAFLRWSVFYSRFATPVMMSLMAETLALYFCFKAVDNKRKLMWFMAGLSMGITWHGPMTFFLMIFPFALYFIITAFSQKGYFRANAVGILAFLLGFWIFGSMIVHNYFISKRIYFGRVSEVSVFSKDPNAPSKNPAKGIVNNTRVVLQMFNHRGDSRQRNSGGHPHEPTVDFLTAMLFAIGFLYALYYSKYYLFFIMVLVFLSQAAGSIFSIEAPSAMRAVGTMVPVVFFAAFTFDVILMSFRKAFGKRLGVIYVPLLILLFAVPIAKENYRQYFQRWIGGMDGLATAAGMYSAELGLNTRIVLYTALYYPGHPPFKFFRWDYKVNSADRFTTGLTRLLETEDEDFAVFFHYDTWNNISSIQQALFPESKLKVVDHAHFNRKLKPGGGFGTFVKSLEVKNEEIKKIRGLTGSYSFGGYDRKNDKVAFLDSDRDKIPYSVTWKGQILLPYYGSYRFGSRGAARYSVSIDGKKLAPGRDYKLAEGFHKISVTAHRDKPGDAINLYLEAKMLDGNSVRKSEMLRLDSKYFYNFRPFGLHGYYYKGPDWTESPLRFEINSTNMCFNGLGIITESAIWKGTIDIPATGKYTIFTRSNGYVRIIIDGKYYWEQASGGRRGAEMADRYFSARKLSKVYNFDLPQGRHKIEIYTTGTRSFELMWKTAAGPGGEPIPVGALQPDFKISGY